MVPRQFYLIAGFTVLLAMTVLLFVGAAFVLNKDFNSLSDPWNKPSSASPTPGIGGEPPSVVTPQIAPEIRMYKSGTAQKPTLVITWKNLPGETMRINVFRTGACAISEWTLWKIINVFGQTTNGAVEIALKLKEANCEFSYRTETAGPNGQITWTSPSGPPGTVLPPDISIPSSTPITVTDPPPPPQPPIVPPISPPPLPPGASPSSTPTSTSPAPLPPVPSSTPPGSSSPSSTDPTGMGHIYYTPQSDISGYDNPPGGQFWVQHAHNNYVELGWQNLPPATTGITIFRSLMPSGPWATLLKQQNVDSRGPYVIRIGDDSTLVPQYYKLEVYAGIALVQFYGPVLLPPLTP